jgi:glycosyltransferase involved in cell wall biosynthesis
MKILLINNKEIRGGSAVIAKALMLGLEKAGHEVSFLVAEKESDNKDVYSIPTSKIRKIFSYLFSNDIDFYKTDYILDLEVFKKADIVNCHNISGHFFNINTLVKMSKLKPVLWTFHDAYPINHYYAHSFSEEADGGLFTGHGFNLLSKILWYRKRYLKKRKIEIYNNSDFSIAAPSQWLIDRIKKTALKDKQIYLVPNGVDPVFFNSANKDSIKKSLGLPNDKKIILFMAHGGSVNPLKGWSYFLEAVEYYKNNTNVLFLVVGENDTKVSGPVRFVEYITDKNEVAKYYAASDVLFFPSLAESFGLVKAEAMASGVPVVCFDIEGVEKIAIHKENGYLAKYKDSEDLINGLNYILNLSQSELKLMSEKSKERIRNNFSMEKMVDNYIEIYKKLISEYENRN